MTSLKCSVFQTVMNNCPCGELEIYRLVTTKVFKQPVEQYRKSLDPKTKVRLPAFTPSGIFQRRRADSLIEPSNVICIDIDGKDNPSISNTDEMKKIVSQLPFVWYCGESVSSTGVYCLIKYKDYTLHKEYFKALQQDFEEIGLIIDKSCSDICRLRIVSYDERPYINLNAEIYEKSVDSPRPNNQISIEDVFISPLEYGGMSNAVSVIKSSTEVVECLMKAIDLSVDITAVYDDWFCIGCVISSIFKESGRELFHKISQFYPGYTYAECDSKYSSILQHGYHYRYERVKQIASKYGVV